MAVLRADGRWMARKQVGGQRHVAYGATETEAEQNLAELLAPVPLLLKSPTLHHFVSATWLPGLRHLEPKSIARYRGCYDKHIAPHLGPLPLVSLTGKLIREYVQELHRLNTPDYTVRYAVSLVGSICRLAVSYDLITRNPCEGIKLPKKAAKRHRAIEPAKAREVLDGLAGTELAAPVFLALTLGLRQGEIAGLMWDDLDRQRGELRIQRQLQEQSGRGVVAKALKTESSKRTLFLPKWIVAGIDQFAVAGKKRGELVRNLYTLGGSCKENRFFFYTFDCQGFLDCSNVRKFLTVQKKEPRYRYAGGRLPEHHGACYNQYTSAQLEIKLKTTALNKQSLAFWVNGN